LPIAPTPLTYTPPPPEPTIAPGSSFDPGPNGWGPYGPASASPGFFFDAEVALVFPTLKFGLTNDRPLPVTGLILNVPAVDLDTTVMPTFEVGYRLGESAGLFALNYSFLFSEGKGRATTDLGTFDVRTRLQVNWWGVDYGTTPFELAPRYEASWRVGVRMADVFFDSRAVNAVLTQESRSDFFGAGPSARFDLERRIVPVPGLALFGRVGGAALVGRVRQRHQVELGRLTDSTSIRRSQLVPYLNLQAGLSYAPPAWPGLKITTGYLFEDYFNVGRLGIDGAGELSRSRGEVLTHGWFLRGQYDF
jgi:hypothetical protein